MQNASVFRYVTGESHKHCVTLTILFGGRYLLPILAEGINNNCGLKGLVNFEIQFLLMSISTIYLCMCISIFILRDFQ